MGHTERIGGCRSSRSRCTLSRNLHLGVPRHPPFQALCQGTTALERPNRHPFGTLSRNHHLGVPRRPPFRALCQGTTTLERPNRHPFGTLSRNHHLGVPQCPNVVRHPRLTCPASSPSF